MGPSIGCALQDVRAAHEIVAVGDELGIAVERGRTILVLPPESRVQVIDALRERLRRS